MHYLVILLFTNSNSSSSVLVLGGAVLSAALPVGRLRGRVGTCRDVALHVRR